MLHDVTMGLLEFQVDLWLAWDGHLDISQLEHRGATKRQPVPAGKGCDSVAESLGLLGPRDHQILTRAL